MEASNGNGGTVKFTLKEIVLEMRDSLREISLKLDNKVDRSDFVELQTRFNSLELHGSVQAVEALKELTKVEADLRQVQSELRTRPVEVKALEKTVDDVADLKLWRNRLLGGWVIATGVAAANAARLFIGF